MVWNSDRRLNWRAFADAAVSRHRRERNVTTVYCIGETALPPGASPYTHRGWTLVSLPRAAPDPRGKYAGGVAMLLPPGVTVTKLTVPTPDGVELDDLLFCSITSRGAQVVMGLMYLLPSLGISSEGWIDQLTAARAMLCAIQDGLVKGVPNTTPVYLGGDFNLRVGDDHTSFEGWCSEDPVIDSRGRAMITWLQDLSMRICNDVNVDRIARFTNFIPNKLPTTVDYFVAEEHRIDIVKDVTTLQLAMLDARDAMHQLLMQHNHRALLVTLELPVIELVSEAPSSGGGERALIGTRMLDRVSDTSRRAYVSYGNDAVTKLWSTIGRENVKAHHLIEVIRKGGNDFLVPSQEFAPIDPAERRVERVRMVRGAVRKLHSAIHAADEGDLGPRHYLRTAVYTAQRALRTVERRHEARRVKAWQVRARTMDISRPRIGWQILNEPRGISRDAHTITALYDENGKLTSDRVAIRARMQQIYASESAEPDPEDIQFSRFTFFDMKRRYEELKAHARIQDGHELSVELTVYEVLQAMLKLNTGRASDFSGMRSELLRWFARYNTTEVCEQPFLLAWTDVLNGIFMRGDPIPEEWRMQILCPVFKRGTIGKPSNPYEGGNYRPVVVCSRLLACLDVAINNRLMKYCLEHGLISDAQYGFIRGRSCEQAISSLSFLREIRQMTGNSRMRRRTYCALIDMRRAFDTTWRERLWVRLHEKGITGAVWLYLQRSNLVDYIRTVLVPGVPMDSWYSDGLGCAQGVILSPLMFDLEFNDVLDVLEQVRAPGAGISIGNRRVYGQLFADDGLLFAETEEGLQAMVDAFAAYCRDSRRRINASKCEVIVMRDVDDVSVTGVTIRIGDETVPEKQSVRYLGAFFGAQDVMPCSPWMPRNGWNPEKSAWYEHALPKLRAAAASVNAAIDMPEYSASIGARFWLSLGLPHSEYGAASLVRGNIPEFERTQISVGKRILNFWPGDSVAGNAVLMELGLWRIQTRHKMCALRLLRDIHMSKPTSQLRAIYDAYLQCCESRAWPAGSWCAWLREILVPLDLENVLHDWDPLLTPRDIAEKYESRFWQSQFEPPPVGLSSLTPHYAGLKTVMGREEHLRHPMRKVAAAVSQARIGYGPWRISRGAREKIPRELRICLHCQLRVPETVTHCLCECTQYNDLRTTMVRRLSERVSGGLRLQLEQPGDNPQLWTQVLLQGHPEELGEDFCVPFRTLSRDATEEIELDSLPPAQLFAAETKQLLQRVALQDRRALFFVGQRFVYNVVRRRLAIERALEDTTVRLRNRYRKAKSRRRHT